MPGDTSEHVSNASRIRTKGADGHTRFDVSEFGQAAMDGAIDVAGATVMAAGKGFGFAIGVGAGYCVLKAVGAPIP